MYRNNVVGVVLAAAEFSRRGARASTRALPEAHLGIKRPELSLLSFREVGGAVGGAVGGGRGRRREMNGLGFRNFLGVVGGGGMRERPLERR